MVKVLTAAFCISLSFIFSFSLFKETKENEDCYFLLPCSLGLSCYDFRCQVSTPNKTDEIPFSPDGLKCNWFHHCNGDSDCNNHRCELKLPASYSPLSYPRTQNSNLKPEQQKQISSRELNQPPMNPRKQQTASQLAQEAPKSL